MSQRGGMPAESKGDSANIDDTLLATALEKTGGPGADDEPIGSLSRIVFQISSALNKCSANSYSNPNDTPDQPPHWINQPRPGRSPSPQSASAQALPGICSTAV
jgi:hypothetical protein